MKRLFGALFYGRVWSQKAFTRLLGISLAGLSLVGGGRSPKASGEAWAARYALAGEGELPVVFDAGAQGGDYTQVILAVKPNARIYAFEPAQKAYDWLREQNYPSNISVIQVGLSKENGKMELYSADGVPGVDSLFMLSYNKYNHYRPSGAVRVCTIDDFCKENGITFISLLKLDIEGSELNALKGATEMIGSRSIRFIQFEHSLHSHDAGYKFKDVFNLLSPHYKISRILEHGLEEIPEATILQEMPFTVNYLAELR